MKAIRHTAFGCLLAIGLVGAIAPLPYQGRVEPHSQTIHPATPEEAKAAELHRLLEQWRTERSQP